MKLTIKQLKQLIKEQVEEDQKTALISDDMVSAEGWEAYFSSAVGPKFDQEALAFGRKFHAMADKLKLNDKTREDLWKYISDIAYGV